MRKYLQIIPEKVCQDLPIIEDLLKPEIKGFSLDNLKEVISVVACHVREDDNRTPLKMIYIKELIPQGDKYLLSLIDLGIIQRSGYAIKGKTSYKYSIASEYHSKYILMPLNNAKLIRRIEKAQEKLRKEIAKSVRSHSEQVRFLKQLSVKEEYKEFIESNYTSETDQVQAF